ncbi:MAG TPA: hypothetical protein PKZ41_03840, partial [Candidatus Omnitrophota bacterium]|nr:hypothetical protein [Candidatus Omnitrophota bacterium]
MKFSEMVASPTGWLKVKGPKDNIVLSTRVRIARNLKNRVYVDRSGEGEREEALKYAMSGIKTSGALQDALYLFLKDLDDL